MSVSENLTLSNEQVHNLARPLVGIINKFYEDPEHRKGFEEWLRNRQGEKEKDV